MNPYEALVDALCSAGFDESKVTRDKGKFATQSGTGPPKTKKETLAELAILEKQMNKLSKQGRTEEAQKVATELQERATQFAITDWDADLRSLQEPTTADRSTVVSGREVATDDAAVARSNEAASATAEALDPDQVELVAEYTDDVASSEVNEELNDGVSADSLARSDVDQALQEAIATETDLGIAPPAVVYRGITHFDAADFEVGTEIEMPAYSSTSVRPDIASGFTDEADSSAGRAVMEIVPLAGTGVHVAGMSENPDEAEYVIGRGSRFEVVGVTSAVFSNGPEQEPGTTEHRVVRLRQLPSETTASGWDLVSSRSAV